MENKTLGDALKEIGVLLVASCCGRTPRAIYKWISKGSLPRTDFCGETDYANKIAKASKGKYTAKYLLEISKKRIGSK